jgi:hypothetical protein
MERELYLNAHPGSAFPSPRSRTATLLTRAPGGRTPRATHRLLTLPLALPFWGLSLGLLF